MFNISVEISFGEDAEKAKEVSERLQNGTTWVGRRHGQWVVFIECNPDEILHLGQELHYELL